MTETWEPEYRPSVGDKVVVEHGTFAALETVIARGLIGGKPGFVTSGGIACLDDSFERWAKWTPDSSGLGRADLESILSGSNLSRPIPGPGVDSTP